MFAGCENLKDLPKLLKWNLSEVIDMRNLFKDCFNLKAYSKFSTSEIFSMNNKKNQFAFSERKLKELFN